MDYFKLGLALSALGAAAKIAGSLAYGSKALLVDGATCVAGLIAGVVALYWLRASQAPPDVDHPYGHERLAFGGVPFMLAAYGAATGFGLAYLLDYREYRVEPGAGIMGLLGLALYTGAVAAFRRSPIIGAPMAAFTASEVLEGLVSTVSAIGGYTLGPMVDYVGAWIIEAYLAWELVSNSRGLVHQLSDMASREAIETVRKELESRGFQVVDVRLRQVVPGEYQGDAVVLPPRGLDPVAADMLADEAAYVLSEKGIDVTVHVDFSRGLAGKRGVR